MRKAYSLLITILCLAFSTQAQDDLLELLEEEEQEEFVTASFKSSRVINGHSLENVATGVMDMRISHRFNEISDGFYDLFGLDGATIRLGLDYGINDRLMVGMGRSTYKKTYDGFLKYKLLRQKVNGTAVSVLYVTGIGINSLRWANPERTNYFTSRLSFFHQLVIGRKFSNATTLQLMPTLVHRNITPGPDMANDVFAMGIAGRQKITNRVALTGEYFYLLPGQIEETWKNSLSVGLDIETGGHVFQLHFTNSRPMFETGFITETNSSWMDGQIFFGFNITRVFTIRKPEEFRE